MNKRHLAVMERRRFLLAKISGQREQISNMPRHWQPALQVADQGMQVARFVRRHPVLLAGVAGLIVVRRSGVQGLLKNSWRLWRLFRYVGELAKKSHNIFPAG